MMKLSLAETSPKSLQIKQRLGRTKRAAKTPTDSK